MARKSKSATTATAGTATLSPFEGKEVIATTIAITRAGDGLSAALAVDPVEMHTGQKVYVVLETEVEKVSFIPSKDSEQKMIRQHTLRAGTSTIVEASLVEAVLDLQKCRIEEAKGIQRLDFDDDGAEPGVD